MSIFLTFIIYLSALPVMHDYHTTLMSLQYNEEQKQFEAELMIETDHFEYAVNKYFTTDLHLGENNEVEDCNVLIEAYLSKTIQLFINKKKVELYMDDKEVDYKMTTIRFLPVPQKKRVKQLKMINKMMLEQFPRQQNLVQVYYKKEQASFLFGSDVLEETAKF